MAVCGHVCRDVWIPQLVRVRVNLGEGCYFNLFAREQRLFPCNINVLATAAAHWNVPQDAVHWSGTSHATRSQPFKSFDISASDVGPFSRFTTIHSMILNRQDAFMDSLDFEERFVSSMGTGSHDSALVDTALTFRRSEPLLPEETRVCAMPLHSPCSLPSGYVTGWLLGLGRLNNLAYPCGHRPQLQVAGFTCRPVLLPNAKNPFILFSIKKYSQTFKGR